MQIIEAIAQIPTDSADKPPNPERMLGERVIPVDQSQ